MSSKAEIIERIKRNTRTRYDMPEINIEAIQYPDRIAQFKEVLKSVGGEALELKQGENINNLIRSYYPEAKTIASNLPELTIATLNPDQASDPHQLTGVELAVVKGEVGVAENACVWVPQLMKERIICFISEYLVILLKKDSLVNTMHEAYEHIDFHDQAYGVFISGPSKTADIEQALVIGAHGAKGVLVILT